MASDQSAHDAGGADIVSLALTREQAYLASIALVYRLDMVFNDSINAGDAFTNAMSGGMRSLDLRDQMRDVARVITTLDAVGWPHDHHQPGFETSDPDIRAEIQAEGA